MITKRCLFAGLVLLLIYGAMSFINWNCLWYYDIPRWDMGNRAIFLFMVSWPVGLCLFFPPLKR